VPTIEEIGLPPVRANKSQISELATRQYLVKGNLYLLPELSGCGKSFMPSGFTGTGHAPKAPKYFTSMRKNYCTNQNGKNRLESHILNSFGAYCQSGATDLDDFGLAQV